MVGKSPTQPAEDGIVATDTMVAVVDGSTSKSPKQLCMGKSNGRFCMELVCEYVKAVSPAIGLNEFCDGVTKWVRGHYDAQDFEQAEKHPEERMAASCIVLNTVTGEIWLIGDCQCLVDGTPYDNPKPTEARLAEKRAREAQRLLRSGECTVADLQRHDLSRQAILGEMVKEMRWQNVAYPVIDGFSLPVDKVRTVALSPGLHSVVLASDGYPTLLPTLAETEAALRQQLANDPLNIGTFKATKGLMQGNRSFDDRAYVRVECLINPN